MPTPAVRPVIGTTTALERARRSLPLVERVTPTDDSTVDVRGWARQLVAVAFEIESVPLLPRTEPEDV